MGRKCSHCGKVGHNSRTCTSYNRCNLNIINRVGVGGLRLFGVQLDISSSPNSIAMKKSLSMDCLPSSSPLSSSPSTSPSPSSSLSSSRVSLNELNSEKNISVGYLSDGLLARVQERKKGLLWSEEEHRRFLIGLEKLGKGDWRGISRNFVTTRTPTQVASHAQKYFLRQASLVKKKRRSSLFDLVGGNNGCNLSTSSSFHDEAHHQENNSLQPLMMVSKKRSENVRCYESLAKWSYKSDMNAYPSGTVGSKSGTLDLELTLASPRQTDQNQSSSTTSSLLLGSIISVV